MSGGSRAVQAAGVSGGAVDASLRAAALGLRDKLAEGLREAEAALEQGGGRACAALLAARMDAIVRALFEGTGEGGGSGMALAAVGGYGRGTLAPHSDIDLLFVLPARQTPADTARVERVLYALWDLGLKVGHATRTVDECLKLSLSDLTIRTAILEARLLCGAADLFSQLMTRFDREVVAGSGAAYAQAKLRERDERHRRAGESRYLVEPNVKDGKGGLRDLQTLFWIGKYFFRVPGGAELVEKGVFTTEEFEGFLRAEDFLWAVRCHMHFLAGKAEERLHFDIQREIASRMGYADAPGGEEPGMGFSVVERFMKAYFITAKEVGDLTRIFCAGLEAEQAKPVWGFGRFLRPRRPRIQKLAGDFLLDNGRVNITDEDAFRRDPVNMLRLFWVGDREGADIHPDALKLLTRSWALVDRTLRGSKEANQLFLDLLTSERDPELNLRRMNEAGLLGRLIPAFGEITAMMQFSLYHHYTVDEHLIRCVGVLAELEKGVGADVHPLSHALLPTLRHARVPLYVAVLLHDVAKNSADHSAAGAALARKICPAMGLSAEDTDLVAWLIEHHLLMSMTAQTRDLNDRKTVDDFAAVVHTVERLKLLLVLTVCDIRGVGPGVWNGWKGQLLRTLYYETELLLTGGFSEVSRAERGAAARAALETALAAWDEPTRRKIVSLHYDNYLLSVDLKDQVRHAEFIREAEAAGKRLAIAVETRQFEAVTVVTVLAPDHPRLLSVIAGACAAAGGNIVSASIFTTTDGRALDTILIAREFDRDEDESRRAERVGRLIADVLSGKAWLKDVIARRAKPRRGAQAFSITPQVAIRNTLSNRFSVIEVTGLDRPGLLSEITGALSDLSLDIASAHITTFGEKAVDTFYVTDLTGAKIESTARTEAVRQRLVAVLAGEPARGRAA